jgi:uncharacterized protein (DUF2336 family)
MTSRLSKDDVARLMADPSPENRVETATKISTEFEQQALSESERKIAEDIFRGLVKDVEVRVRETLSTHLKAAPDLPHDIAMALAKDVESVALPVLKFSEVLTDDDLIEVVRDNSAGKQVAIAQRDGVSARVADALIDTGNETAVSRLVANETADLGEEALDRVVTDYGESESVSDSLTRRPNLPPAISEQLVSALSERMQEFLVAKHDLPPDQMSNLILQAREKATISLLSDGSGQEELDQLVEQLHVKGRLTVSLILRALCMGNIPFFEAALARLARVPVQNARILIYDQGSLGLKSLYTRAGLPEQLFPAMRAAADVAGETQYDGGRNDRERFVGRMLERILTQFEDPSEQMSEDDLEYLMKKLQQIAA